jgi:hypothetical protein
MILTLFNPETDDLEKSYLSNSYSAGTTSIEVKNNDSYAASDRIMIGEMGQEKTEIVTVSSVNGNGTTMVIGATVFSHEADTPVYRLRFDQVKFYRSTDGGTNYTLLATVDMDVDNANLTTIYDDTTGTTAYYYKMTVYHSVSTLESAYTDVIQGSGWRRGQVGNVIDEILQEVGDQNETNISRTELLGYFNDVNDDLLTSVSKPYDFLHSRTTLTRTANTNYINFPTDSNGDQTMWKFDRMDYNYTDTSTDPDTDYTVTIPVMDPELFRNTYTDNTISTTTVTDAVPVAMTLDTSVNRFRFSAPFETTTSNVFYLHYWKYFDTINSEGDEVETPTPKIYKLYSKAMYYRKQATSENSFNAIADRYEAQYMQEKSKYKMVDRKDKGTPRGFRPANSTFREYRK